MKYTAEEFIEKYNVKPGVVAVFKKFLKDNGLLGSRGKLSEEHCEFFIKAKEIKENQNHTWVDSFDLALNTQEIRDQFPETSDQKQVQSSVLSAQIKGILSLYDDNTLDEKQVILVIKKLVEAE